MKISRRDFLKWMITSGVAVGVGKVGIEKATHILANILYTPVIWLQASGCSGCTIAFLNMVENNGDNLPTVDNLLLKKIDLKYHNNIMAASGREAMEILASEAQLNNRKYILIVEGGIPTAQNGIHCIIGEKDGKPYTALQAVRDLSENAQHIIAIGTCAAFKGVAGAGANPTGVNSVEGVLGSAYAGRIINLPGCPVHPYIIGETIVKLLAGEQITKDSRKRPIGLYTTKKLHDNENNVPNCPLKGRSKTNRLGVCGNCFDELGCKGKEDETRVTCYTRYWGTDWRNTKGCFGAGNMCIGCSNPNFPFAKIYK
jgi:hydrogenase small subunit